MADINPRGDLKKVETFKSGPFYFSRRYDKQALAEKLVEARVLQQVVAEMPILPSLASSLRKEAVIRSIHATAALDGNPLSGKEVGGIMSAALTGSGAERAVREIENLKACCLALEMAGTGPGPFLMSLELMIRYNGIITGGTGASRPGSYRDRKLSLGGPEQGFTYTPPKKASDIQTLTGEFADWINSPALLAEPPLVRAALAHYHMILIQPFADANGRTARMLEALLMRVGGIKYAALLLSDYYYHHKDGYQLAFARSVMHENREVTPFLDFVLTGIIDSTREALAWMTGHIREITLREYFSGLAENREITGRQHELLKIMLDQAEPFTLRELWSRSPFSGLYLKVSERTGRRDLDRLVELGLLAKNQDKAYSLNLRRLDAV